MKPIIKWVGGKTQLLNILIEKMQLDTVDYSNATYVEPFIGGGALFLYLVEQDVFKSYIINDINTRLINIYNTVKYDVDGLIQELDYLKNLYLNLNEEDRSILYYEKRKRFNEITITDYNIESASLFIFLNKTCFNGLYRENKSGGFNAAFGKYESPAFFCESDLRKLSVILNTKDIKILNGSYEDFEQDIPDNSFVYLDPPYRPITKGGFTNYNKSNFNDDAQIELKNYCDRLHDRDISFLLSNSDSKMLDPNDNFFDELYKDYAIERVQASRLVNCDKTKRGAINEILIYNSPGKKGD